MKLEVSRKSIEREKRALKRAQSAGYTRTQAKTLLRKYYRSGNDDVAKLDDWIRSEELRRGNKRISTKNPKSKKAVEFSESDIAEKEKELAERVFDGWQYGLELSEFGDLELKAAAKLLGLNVKGNLSKAALVKKIDDALCKPPECSREEPKWLKEVSSKVYRTIKKSRVMKKKKKGTKKPKKSYRKPNRQSEKSPVKNVVGVVQRAKKRTVTFAEVLPFAMPKMF